eukprot:4606716-Pleurochrysis_carterae.AAC.1
MRQTRAVCRTLTSIHASRRTKRKLLSDHVNDYDGRDLLTWQFGLSQPHDHRVRSQPQAVAASCLEQQSHLEDTKSSRLRLSLLRVLA